MGMCGVCEELDREHTVRKGERMKLDAQRRHHRSAASHIRGRPKEPGTFTKPLLLCKSEGYLGQILDIM